MRITRQALAAATAVGLAAAGGSAFTASNTVPTTTRVGQAASATSGYTVSGVVYTLSASTANGAGDHVARVDMDVTPETTGSNAREVRVRFTTTGTWYPCTGTTAAVAWVCTISPTVSAASVTHLDVVAVN